MAVARWHGALAIAALLAACDEPPLVITPVIEAPFEDPDATATPLDEITLTVAHAGSDRDLVSQTFAHGETLELPGVPFGDDLVVHMTGFVGASSIAYGRSCDVVISTGDASPRPHLFFSRSAKFGSIDIAPLPRFGGLGISYLGTGLLVGGDDSTGNPIQRVERFDPLTGQLSTLGVVSARDGAVHALIGTSPPRVVVVGGALGSDPAKFVEVLDGRGIDRLDFSEMARIDLTATSLTDGRVIVIGGRVPGQAPSGEIDEIGQDGTALEVRRLGATLAHPRAGHTATRLGDDVGAPVLIAGGIDAGGTLVTVAELFKPLSEELANPSTFHPTLAHPRRGHTATRMPDGSVLIIGGVDAIGAPVRALELFSLDAGFIDVGDLPDGAGIVDISATTLPDGRILLTGGRQMPTGSALNSAFIAQLDPLSGLVDVRMTDGLALARARHQTLVLCDGTVLVTGGTTGQFPAERYNPPPAGRR